MAVFVDAKYDRKSGRVGLLSHAGRLVARLHCHRCGAHEDWNINGRAPPPDQLITHFKNAGWSIRNRDICPACQVRTKEITKVATVNDNKAELPTPAVRAAKVKATEHLMAYFNMQTGQYDVGWSDDRVAKESGMPIQWVVKRREEDFGPLREPDEFVQLRCEVEGLTSEVGKLMGKIDAMAKRNGWAA